MREITTSANDSLLNGFLRSNGLLGDTETAVLTPLTGGVSSDIYLVETGERRFCIKRALARLKVAAEWRAPVARNAAEAAWLRQVGAWLPDCVPEILAVSPQDRLFAMVYLPQASYPVWKQRLRDGAIEPEFAAQVGRRLAHIHARSAHDPVLAEAFANEATFAQIRLDPYLRASAQRHPDLAARLHQLADSTGRIKRALVHGDVSPKNILCGPRDPVFIDAECACYGDPAFDLAFCLNHLLLKGLWKPHWRMDYLHCFNALTAAYLAAVDWESPAALEGRCAALLPGLLLARVDGKSPVEYIDRESQRRRVRAVARQLLIAPAARLNSISALWGDRHG